MRTFRCLLVLPMLSSVAMRPSLELESQRQAVPWKRLFHPCAKRNAESKAVQSKVKRSWWRSRTICECIRDFLTSSSCSTPLKKSFDPKDEQDDCSCEDPCGRFGAERKGELCRCDASTHAANLNCSRPGERDFPLEGNSEGCHCVNAVDWADSIPNPVKASALAFCEAAMKTTDYSELYSIPSVESCRALVAGLPNSPQGLSSEFKTVEELSEHPSARGLGRLDPLVDAKPTAMWHLQQVCRDECEDLVIMTRSEGQRIQFEKRMQTPKPPFMGCAERVVKKVEAEMLGCCGRSCGWNGDTCMAWPFIEESDKVEWLAECCTEYNVLKGSKRELMCDSVLNARDARVVSANDTSQEGADVGGAFLGQDPQLLWTKAGVKSWLGKKYSYLDPKPTDGGQVPELLLALEPNVRREALQQNWFKETRTEIEPASLMQLQDECEKDMNTCHKDFRTSRLKSCAKQKGWKYTSGTSKQLSDESRSKLKQQVPEHRATSKSPSDCTVLKSYGSDWKMEQVRHFLFEYTSVESKEVSEKWSIRCFMETKKDMLNLGPGKDLVEAPKPLNSLSKKAVKVLNFNRILYWVEASTL